MTANQQLKDYIVEQTKLGVSKDVVKSTLLGAGWKEDDINQAVTEAESGPQEIAPLKPASLVQPAQQASQGQSTQQTQAAQPAKPAEVLQAFKPVNMPASSGPVAKNSPVPFVTSDIFQPKSEQVFQSSVAKIQTQTTSNPMENKPQVVSMAQNNKLSAGISGKVLPISLGVISIILLGGNVYFFLQNGDIRSKFDSLNSGKVSSENQTTSFESQATSLAADKKTLTDEVDSLNKTIVDLNSQISIFAAPAENASATSVSFDVSGTLGGGGKFLYSLTTSKNIVLFVKNSKDAKVNSALKSLLSTRVQLGGTHEAESNYLTVETVNGQSVLEIAKAAAAAQASTSTSTQSSGQTSASTSGTGAVGTAPAVSSTPAGQGTAATSTP